MEEQKYTNLRLSERGAIISIVAYIFLSIVKIAVGYISNSDALQADGYNNMTDIIGSVAVLIGLKLAQRPPDEDHGYGHWKSETIASLIASIIMFAIGFKVLFDAFSALLDNGKEAPDILSAYVGIFSALVMYLVYRYNKKLAIRTESKAVMAAAKDNLSDSWVSIGTSVGIFSSQLNMPWLDTLTAIIVGLLIIHTAWGIFRQASHELTDGFDEEKLQVYHHTILNIDGVKGIKEIKGRNYGNNEVIDVVILVNSTLNINEAHDIANQVEETLMKEYGVYSINVHVEPN